MMEFNRDPITFDIDGQWQIQDFPEEGTLTPKGGANLLFDQFFLKTA